MADDVCYQIDVAHVGEVIAGLRRRLLSSVADPPIADGSYSVASDALNVVGAFAVAVREPWPDPPEGAVAKIAERWRALDSFPRPGDIGWLVNTAKGEEIGRSARVVP